MSLLIKYLGKIPIFANYMFKNLLFALQGESRRVKNEGFYNSQNKHNTLKDNDFTR